VLGTRAVVGMVERLVGTMVAIAAMNKGWHWLVDLVMCSCIVRRGLRCLMGDCEICVVGAISRASSCRGVSIIQAAYLVTEARMGEISL
jgi:hypothetical protein